MSYDETENMTQERVSTYVKQQHQSLGINARPQKARTLIGLMFKLDEVINKKKKFGAEIAKQVAPMTEAQKRTAARYKEIISNLKQSLEREKEYYALIKDPFYNNVEKEYKRLKTQYQSYHMYISHEKHEGCIK